MEPIFLLILSIVSIVLGYFIYGWYDHRKRRLDHYHKVESELVKQSIYLKALSETLANDRLIEIKKDLQNNKK